jgi:hypothetical protein
LVEQKFLKNEPSAEKAGCFSEDFEFAHVGKVEKTSAQRQSYYGILFAIFLDLLTVKARPSKKA